MRTINSMKISMLIYTGDFSYRDIDWETYSTKKNPSHYESKFIECQRHVSFPTCYRFHKDIEKV